MLLDWARVARKLGKIPTVTEYESRGGFSDMPFHTRYGNWTSVPDAFLRFARKEKIQGKWKDVLGMIGAQVGKAQHGKDTSVTRAHAQAGHLSGPSAVWPADEFAGDGPRAAERNGSGVCVWTGGEATGIQRAAIPGAFPDCEAFGEVVRGQLQRMKLEFEYESRNFLRHGHRIDGCDGIVCWKHNWKECPLEVIELSKVLPEP